MFGKKKTEATPEPEAKEVAPKPHKGYTLKKAIPTPSRKKANAVNRQPIVVNCKAMSREERRGLKRGRSEVSTVRWNKQQEAMRTDDERNMSPQHAGPVRRLGRDVIDSRFSPGSYLMPLALLLLVGLFAQRFVPRLFVVFTALVYAIFIVIAVWTGKNVRRAWALAEHKLGADRIPQGSFMQLFSRALYPRCWRMPRPQVAPGNIPVGADDVDYKETKTERKKGRGAAARRCARRPRPRGGRPVCAKS